MLLFFGVLLPAITLGFELLTGASSDIYVDPIPTWWHVFLVASVPTINALCISAIQFGTARKRSTLFLLNGLAMGISGVYALVYLPLSIAGVFGILAFGIGLLPLSPVLSFIASIYLCKSLVDLPPNTLPNQKTLRPSLAVAVSLATGILCVAIPEARPWMTEQAVQMAVNGNADTKQQGIKLLRNYANERELATQLRTFRTSSLTRRVDWVDRDEANELFFRVTGKQLNRVPTRRPRDRWFSSFDDDLGGEAVGKRVEGLSMKSSRIDAEIDADTSVTYTEWTMVFQNEGFVANEARAQILLPPGGVVSRLTLWVNGEPREAAFSSTGKVRSAYQEVAVRQRRDPVLVTWKGKDRVLMQCFPVPARGGTMKVRVGVTAPLQWKSGYGSFGLPRIIEQNYEADVRHAVWIDSDAKLQSDLDHLVEKEKDNQFATSGQLTSTELSSNEFRVLRKPDEETFTIEAGDSTLQGSIESQRTGQPKHVVFVIDGSMAIQPAFGEIATFIGNVNSQTKVDVLLASEAVIDLSSFSSDPDELKKQLDAHKRRGGFDGAPALVQAWDRADEQTDVVWIHGLQPLDVEDHDPFKQRIERDFVAPTLWDLQVNSGPNRIMEGVQDRLNVERISHAGNMAESLKRWWVSLKEPAWRVAWTSLPKQIEGSSVATAATETGLAELGSETESESSENEMPQVVSYKQPKAVDLWAFEKVRKLLRESRNADNQFALRDEATQFAAASHLVTPVSGAVVLETQEQYDRAGLVPEDQKHVVSTPEPSSAFMMVFTLLPIFHLARRRRR